jgi:hypothetical protein
VLFVDLKPAPNNKDMFNVQYIQQCKIKFEPPKQKGTLLNVQIAKDMGTPKSIVTSNTMPTQDKNQQNPEYHKEVCWTHFYTYCTRQICQQPTTLQ